MNQRPPLRELLARADLAELDDDAQAFGRAAVAEAIADPAAVIVPPPATRNRELEEEERQRVLDAALGDVIEIVARHRARLGRRVCSLGDARTIREIHALLRSMSDAGGGADGDASFQ